jgi:hypothetical protein
MHGKECWAWETNMHDDDETKIVVLRAVLRNWFATGGTPDDLQTLINEAWEDACRPKNDAARQE